MSITLSALQKQRRDSAANWTAENPTLLAGEIGIESDTGYWKVGDGSTAWTSLAYISGLGAEIPVSRLADGSARQLLQTAANGTDVEWTSNVDIPGTLDVTGAATFDAAVTIQGNLTVNGTTTTIDTQNLIVEDKNVIIGQVTTPTDVTADGGGITLKGTTDKTINWVDATDAWTSSERFSVPTGTAAAPTLTFTGDPNTGIYSPGADQLALSTNGTGRLFVDASGRVGVGAASAGAKLRVNVGTDQNFAVTSTNSVAQLQGINDAGNAFVPIDIAGSNIRISPNSSEIARFTSTGLGIGTSLPGANLDLVDGNTYSGIRVANITTDATIKTGHFTGRHYTNAEESILGLRISSDGTVNQVALGGGSGLLNSATSIQFYTAANTTTTIGTQRMVIDSAGRVGIGTTSPSDPLHVLSSGGTVKVDSSTNGGSSSLLFDVPATNGVRASGGNRGKISCEHSGVGWDASLVFYAGANGGSAPTEALRIDPSKRLLIGTSTHSGLNVSGYSGLNTYIANTGDTGISLSKFSNDAAGASIQFIKSRGASVGTNALVSNGDSYGALVFGGADGNGFIRGSASIEALVDATPGAGDMPGRLVFSTTPDSGSSPVERVRITSIGDVFIGTTTAGLANTTGFGFNQATNSSSYLNIGHASPSASGQEYLGFSYGGSQIGSIRQSGTTAVTYNTTSDYRLKENLIPIANAIGRIASIPTYRFNFISEPERTVDGFIAHEVQAIVPEAVTGEKDAVDADGNPIYQGIDQSKLVPLLTAALQEAIGEIESLKARVAALETA